MTTGDNSGRKQPGKLGLLAPGTLVDGRFTILDFIGEGGSAVVYVAEQKTMRRKVALKVLKPELGPEARRQFVIELRAVGALSDPHTISVYDAGASDDGLLYIAMELLRGRPLSELITQGPIALDRAVRIADQVLDSIEEAHAAGIIHGDLKPENLFISGRPGSEFVKVLDFGIATFFREQSATFDSELSVGTPHYMSPEQVRGHKLDPRTDLYSLAVILYEMVAGKLPFEWLKPLTGLRSATLQWSHESCTRPAPHNSSMARYSVRKGRHFRTTAKRELTSLIQSCIIKRPLGDLVPLGHVLFDRLA